MKKRKVVSDKFPPYDTSYGPIKWMNQHDVYSKYKNDGMTKEFLAYNRSNQFRNRKTITEDDILKVKRTGACGCLYRNDTNNNINDTNNNENNFAAYLLIFKKIAINMLQIQLIKVSLKI